MVNKPKTSLLKKIIIIISLIIISAASVLTYVVLQMPWMNWDNTEDDINTTMPGDNLSPQPNWSFTHAITIKASAEKIWPYINQIGQVRSGFYSYTILENLIHPNVPNLSVEKVIPNIALIQHGGTFDKYGISPKVMTKDYLNITRVFYLQKLDWNKTRLLIRWRAVYNPSKENELLYGPQISGFMNFLMGDGMIREIKSRAEKY